MAEAPAGETVRRVEHLMGMPISLAMRGKQAASPAAELAWQTALNMLRNVDTVFSTYRETSWISRLERGEVDLVDCPPEVAEVFDIADQACRLSDGAFDIWLPDADGRQHLDPSGIVKGWAVERASAAFDDLSETDICLAAGGDMTCRTRVPGATGWNVGIENPSAPTQVVAVVPVRNGAVATSGTAHRGEHIVDPRTGRPPAHFSSVTVIGADLTWVDIEATTAFVLGPAASDWLAGRGRSGVATMADGSIRIIGTSA
jgi:thiamine biosynthesis lipoprotein